MNILVTGGGGFIGSALCRHLVAHAGNRIINVDKLTYAGSRASLGDVDGLPNYRLVPMDIHDSASLVRILQTEMVELVVHLAAETHVDRSIDAPAAFVHTNIVGTYRLLEAVLTHWRSLSGSRADRFRFHHVSTDEVFGDLASNEGRFREDTAYAPSSPYSASKAAADHLVRAWGRTYGLPFTLSNCSNNYGPYHFPEKLIPLTILNALEEKPLLVYGDGGNVRDWLYVDDHVGALTLVATNGKSGESYNIGGNAERTNLDVVQAVCDLLDRKRPRRGGASHRGLITFVEDRPGHDRRYAVDIGKIRRELGWVPLESFSSGLERTVDWYIENGWWWEPIRNGRYAGERLGQLEMAG